MDEMAPGSLGHVGKTIQFETPAERSVFLEDVRSVDLMVNQFGSGHYIAHYDTAKIDFAAEVRRLIVSKGIVSEQVAQRTPLEKLHTVLSTNEMRLDDSELNKVSKGFYETSDSFLSLYRRFMRDVVTPLFGEDLYFQGTPTLRFQFPHQDGFNWRPRIHTDIMLGHPPAEVNVWLPFTRAYGTNTMMIASLEDSLEILEDLSYDFAKLAWLVQKDADFWQSCAKRMRPASLEYGAVLLFDPRCLHATQNNVTDSTRISTDVRVILRRKMENLPLEYRGTGRLRMLFAPGHYYDAQPTSAVID